MNLTLVPVSTSGAPRPQPESLTLALSPGESLCSPWEAGEAQEPVRVLALGARRHLSVLQTRRWTARGQWRTSSSLVRLDLT